MSVEWHGAERLTMAIRGSSRKVIEQSGKVVKNNAELVQRFAKVYAPRDTGFLESQINTSYPQALEAHINAEAAYSGYQEYGTRLQINAEAAYSGYQEYGTRFQTGKPFMRPALKVVEPKFKQDMTDVLKGVFE